MSKKMDLSWANIDRWSTSITARPIHKIRYEFQKHYENYCRYTQITNCLWYWRAVKYTRHNKWWAIAMPESIKWLSWSKKNKIPKILFFRWWGFVRNTCPNPKSFSYSITYEETIRCYTLCWFFCWLKANYWDFFNLKRESWFIAESSINGKCWRLAHKFVKKHVFNVIG